MRPSDRGHKIEWKLRIHVFERIYEVATCAVITGINFQIRIQLKLIVNFTLGILSISFTTLGEFITWSLIERL